MVTFEIENLNTMNAKLKEFSDYLLGQCVLEDDVFASKLVSCELITNVIRHGGDKAVFSGSISDDMIYITVTAKSFEGLNLNTSIPDVFAENGRGLYIIKSLCHCLEHGKSGEICVTIKRH